MIINKNNEKIVTWIKTREKITCLDEPRKN